MESLKPTPLGITWIVVGFILLLIVAASLGPELGSTKTTMGLVLSDGKKIVSAIESYRDDHGALPSTLDDLIPRYLLKLNKVAYLVRRSQRWPNSLFNGYTKSPWAYKISHDKTNFALAVEDEPDLYYDSKTEEWNFYKIGITAYEKTTSTSATLHP